MPSQLDRLTAQMSPPNATVGYGATDDQVYDVRLPKRPRGITMLLLHGGFWRPAYDRQHTTAQATALTRNGFHVASVEYRRAPWGGWPTLRADLLDAVDAIRADSRLPDPWLTMGHSAGGHLALWLQHQDVAAGTLGTVALALCADLRRTHELRLDGDAALALLGTAPQGAPAAWRAADPSLLGPPPAPVRLVHGDRDSHVPLEVSRAYVDAVGADRVRLDVVAGAGHYDLIDPESAHFDHTLRAAEALAGHA